MAEAIEVTVPDIGDFDDVEVVEVLVAVGDAVEAEQSLITLESDKASMEVPSPHDGTITRVDVKPGDKVAMGAAILLLTPEAGSAGAAGEAGPGPAPPTVAPAAPTADEPAPPGAPATPASDAAEPPAPPTPRLRDQVIPGPARHAGELPYASPSVRKIARERGIDLSQIRGSGRNGRILAQDLERTAQSAAGSTPLLPAMPEIDYSQFGATEIVPLTRINRLTAENLHRSWLHVPHVTQHDEADITELDAFRKAHKPEAEQRGFKLTFVAFLLAASAAALRAHPRFNASLLAGGQELVLKEYINIGVAVDTPKGLVVPVIREVDHKGIYELAQELGEVSGRAREGKLTATDIQGGSFTISSLGGIGGTAFTPIVNAPEVAILGVSRSRMQPIWHDGEFRPRLMLPLSLSYDHRVIDGAAAARFTSHLGRLLGDLRTILL